MTTQTVERTQNTVIVTDKVLKTETHFNRYTGQVVLILSLETKS